MTDEIAAYFAELQRAFDKLCAAIEGLDAATLNWKPPVPEANSVYVIATHLLGNAEAWVLGIACGQPIKRDRAAEFAASGDDAAALAERARDLLQRIEAALAALPDEALGQLRPSPQQLWGAGSAEPVTTREALLHVVQHANTHLGHIDVTRDLALAAAKA